MSEDTQKIRDLVERLHSAEFSESEREILLYALLVKQGMGGTLAQIFNNAEDRTANYEKILAAVQMIKGKAFGFSQHGIVRRLDEQFSDDQKAQIAAAFYRLSKLLMEELGISSFVTSGTLLGLVREGRFLPHDFDFDMAYISKKQARDKVSEERRDVQAVINASNFFHIGKEFLGKAIVSFKIDGEVINLDLFVGYRNGNYFNEVPLKPDTILFDDIAPVKTMKLYGSDVFVPKEPEKLLELNYGSSWRNPDPSFKFDFSEHAAYYWFLKKSPAVPG